MHGAQDSNAAALESVAAAHVVPELLRAAASKASPGTLEFVLATAVFALARRGLGADTQVPRRAIVATAAVFGFDAVRFGRWANLQREARVLGAMLLAALGTGAKLR